MRNRKILVMGPPGAGKKTLAAHLAQCLGAVRFNGDALREAVHRDLAFTSRDMVEHARRLGWLCDRVAESGGYAVADFTCASPDARAAFMADGDAYVVWLDTVASSTSPLIGRFVPPDWHDVRVSRPDQTQADGGPLTRTASLHAWAEHIAAAVRPVYDPRAPAALLIGRCWPLLAAHRAVIAAAVRRTGQVCIALRPPPAPEDGWFDAARTGLLSALADHSGRIQVIALPSVTQVLRGTADAPPIDIDLLDPGASARAGSREQEPPGSTIAEMDQRSE